MKLPESTRLRIAEVLQRAASAAAYKARDLARARSPLAEYYQRGAAGAAKQAREYMGIDEETIERESTGAGTC